MWHEFCHPIVMFVCKNGTNCFLNTLKLEFSCNLSTNSKEVYLCILLVYPRKWYAMFVHENYTPIFYDQRSCQIYLAIIQICSRTYPRNICLHHISITYLIIWIFNQRLSRLNRNLWFTYESVGICPTSSTVDHCRLLAGVAMTKVNIEPALSYNDPTRVQGSRLAEIAPVVPMRAPRLQLSPCDLNPSQEISAVMSGCEMLVYHRDRLSSPIKF